MTSEEFAQKVKKIVTFVGDIGESYDEALKNLTTATVVNYVNLLSENTEAKKILDYALSKKVTSQEDLEKVLTETKKIYAEEFKLVDQDAILEKAQWETLSAYIEALKPKLTLEKYLQIKSVLEKK